MQSKRLYVDSESEIKLLLLANNIPMISILSKDEWFVFMYGELISVHILYISTYMIKWNHGKQWKTARVFPRYEMYAT